MSVEIVDDDPLTVQVTFTVEGETLRAMIGGDVTIEDVSIEL